MNIKTTIFKLKHYLRQQLLERPVKFHLDSTLENVRFGNSYGGWHVLTEPLNQSSIVYSFGVGEDLSFDCALADRFGLTVHCFDPTPKSLEWVQNQTLPSTIQFHPYGISAEDGVLQLFPPANPDHVSYKIADESSIKGRQPIEVPVRRLASIMQSLKHRHIDLLKMDIEGSEYHVIDDLVRGVLPKQLLIEFHHRYRRIGKVRETRRAIKKLRNVGYKLFYVSEHGEEFSFVLT